MAIENRKRALEAEVREIINSNRSDEEKEGELAQLIEPRIDESGGYFFVRKTASRGRRGVLPSERVDVVEVLDYKRVGKRDRYLALASSNTYTGPFFLAEGDSWFEYFWAKDMIQWMGGKYAVLSLARNGDTWNDIISQDVDPPRLYPDETPMGLLHTLDSNATVPVPSIVMISAGGNDLINRLVDCVHDFDKDRDPDDYIDHSGFDSIINYVQYDCTQKAKQLEQRHCKLVLHGYDYPNVKDGGMYIGWKLEHICGFPAGSTALMRRVMNRMIDEFAKAIEAVANAHSNAHFVDFRGVIGTKDWLNGPDTRYWQDEMHGNAFGSKKLWQHLDDKLDAVIAHP
jgi:hypothetical protein